MRAASTPTAPRAPTARRTQDDRCESPVANGDTYGPVNYAAYVPAVAVTGWTGRWDDLPASHGTSSIFDLACVAGMAAVGWRFGRMRLALVCALAWVAYPFTGYALQANTNDMIVAAFAIWGFAFAAAPVRRGVLLALASLDEVRAARAVAALEPLSARRGRAPQLARARPRRPRARHAARRPAPAPRRRGRAAAVLGSHGRLPDRPLVAVLDLGVGDLSRLPDLGGLQTALEALLVTCSVALAFRPRRLDAVQLAALSGALILGFELVLTHWSYLYLPWAFPFVLLALVLPSRQT